MDENYGNIAKIIVGARDVGSPLRYIGFRKFPVQTYACV